MLFCCVLLCFIMLCFVLNKILPEWLANHSTVQAALEMKKKNDKFHEIFRIPAQQILIYGPKIIAILNL